MRLNMRERKSVIKILAVRYRTAAKKEKGVILNEFVKLTRFHRVYARTVLRQFQKNLNQVPLVKTRKPRKRIYDVHVIRPLQEIWKILDCLCGKRLAPALKEVVPVLEKYGEIKLTALARRKLLSISPAAIDRLLASERKKLILKGRSGTKPGTLLKHQIPIRTFSDWNENRPGFLEVDLVGHEGGNARGDFAQTLDTTDVCTGWTETQAVQNKAQLWVFQAFQEIASRLPFPVLGMDSDNGSEFINQHMLRYCQQNKITFTRSRSCRKNDNCFVEQKNYSVVRRTVGYFRYDTPKELSLLNQLYRFLRLYTNFFQPTMKLLKKTRIGSKVKKWYDTPQTPYARVLHSQKVSNLVKQKLETEYKTLNPAELKRQITRLQSQLFETSRRKSNIQEEINLSNKTVSKKEKEIKNNQKIKTLREDFS